MLLVLTISVAGWQASAQTTSTLYTYSTIDALLAGTYDGDLTIRELSAKGDFGIGTFNRLTAKCSPSMASSITPRPTAR